MLCFSDASTNIRYVIYYENKLKQKFKTGEIDFVGETHVGTYLPICINILINSFLIKSLD